LSSLPLFCLVSHGTDGSDKLEPGVHLRWQFDRRLGFPSDGFYLYRRRSCSRNVCIDFNDFSKNSITLPYEHNIISQEKNYYAIVISSFTSQSNGKDEIMLSDVYGGASNRSLLVKIPISINLPENTRAVEIEANFGNEGFAQITLMMDGREIDTQSFFGIGSKLIRLSVFGANSIVAQGRNFGISRICFIICEDCEENPWEGPLNQLCGFGLPFDWDMAACRLPRDRWDQFEGQPFKDLVKTLDSMVKLAEDAPMGWAMMSFKDESRSIKNKESSPEFQVSLMDMVLITSIDPYMARILELYWVDKSAIDGELYDYKIEGKWLGHPKRLWNLENVVDFEVEKEGKKFFNLFKKDSFVFFSSDPGIVDYEPSRFARANKGLHILLQDATTGWIRIDCTQPVKELQLFVRHQGRSVTLEAFHNNALVDFLTLTTREGVLAVRHEQNIDYVVLRTKDIIIYKICWDPEYIGDAKREFTYTECGVKKGIPQPLDVPTGLKAFSFPGMIRATQDGPHEDHRFNVGLTWDIPKITERRFIGANITILYHVERRNPGGEVEWLTKKSPVKVVAESFRQAPLWSKAWPQQRIFYIDDSEKKSLGRYEYRISAIDIFGRVSAYTSWVSIDLTATLPPPPSGIEAKLLDPLDPSLTGDEKAWVTANGRRGLKVRWNWTESLKRQAPDVSAFKIYFQPGWLNVVQGEIEADPVENGELLELSTGYVSNVVPAVHDNVFAGEKMLMNMTNYNIESSKTDATTGKFIFSIRKPIPITSDFCTTNFGTFKITNLAEIAGSNNLEVTIDYNIPVHANVESLVGETLTIRQKQYSILSCRKDTTNNNAVFIISKIYPRTNDFFSIPISQQREPPAGTFIDYRNASSWQQILHMEPRTQNSKQQYEIIIPDPPLVADRTNKVVYAQIGISCVNSEGGEGSVSSPTSIIAVFREPPPPQRLEDSANMYVSVPNYYGKSSYALRWPKSGTDIRYFVYRAMDESLFSVDKEIRSAIDAAGNPLRSRDPANYIEFLNNFDASHHSDIRDKIIIPDTIDYRALTRDPLKNTLLKALASLPGNEKAFAKLHEQAIHSGDAVFANRNTDAPAPGTEEPEVDPNLLLYVDENIDGMADNMYFYRIRTVNEVGALGSFGLSTPPIYLPQTTLPRRPTITKTESGDRQITIKWTANYEHNLSGFVIYRTYNERLASDVRRMQALKGDANDNDVLTVSISDPSSTEYTYVDNDVEPRLRYYYRITTTGSSGLVSYPSDIVVCEPIEVTPPVPPEWEELIRSLDGTNAILRWKTLDPLQCIVKRRRFGSASAIPVSDWLSPDSFDDSTKYWHYRWIDDGLDASAIYSYYILGRNRIGVQVESSEEEVSIT
jgi:hypothetical protein